MVMMHIIQRWRKRSAIEGCDLRWSAASRVGCWQPGVQARIADIHATIPSCALVPTSTPQNCAAPSAPINGGISSHSQAALVPLPLVKVDEL